MEYDPTQKPNSKVCPHQFCFMWQMATLTSAETAEPASIIEGCRCPWVCTRLDAERGEHDYYEAHEPNLRKAGLPWFYFYSSPSKLVAELQADYIRESEALWGFGHWREE